MRPGATFPGEILSLSDLASLGSLFSDLAVLASLAFLFFQMRQMSEQVRQADRDQQATIRQTRADRGVSVSFTRLEPSVALAVRKGLDGDEDISLVELEQFSVYMHGFLLSLEETFHQHRAGLIDDVEYADFRDLVRGSCNSLGMRITWRTRKPRLGKDFSAWIEEIMAQQAIVPPRDRIAEWKKAAAELKASAAG
jgi:hypothetical protein